MATPDVPQKSPYVLNLEAGKYYWCACGKSAKQPFCDGSHKGSEFVPKLVEITESKTVALCGCKNTSNGVFCDGTHAKL